MNSSESKLTKIGWNSIITLVLSFVAVGVSWGVQKAEHIALEKRVTSLENRNAEQLEALNENVTILRVEVAKLSGDMEWLKTTINKEK